MGYKVIGVFGKEGDANYPLVYVDFKFQGDVHYLRGVLKRWKKLLQGLQYIKIETILE